MKLGTSDRLVSVAIAEGDQDIVITSRKGMTVRFPVSDIRIFVGRGSTGVRGIRLDEGDRVVAMYTVSSDEHLTPEDRDTYVTGQLARRRLLSSGENRDPADIEKDKQAASRLQDPRYSALEQTEQFIFAVTDDGFAQLASAYDFRVVQRGGKGVRCMRLNDGREIVSCQKVDPKQDELVLSSDAGQLLRCRLSDGFSRRRRGSKGVRIFDLAEGQRVISATLLAGQSKLKLSDGPVQ